MKNKILQLIILISFLFALGEMPKGWDIPSEYKEESKSIIGTWNIDINKVIEEYRKTPEYKEAADYAEIGVEMIKQIFSSMKFEFKDNGEYVILGIPNPNGETEDFQGTWYENNDSIVLQSPENNNSNAVEDLIFKLYGNNTLVPQNKEAGMFYLIREN